MTAVIKNISNRKNENKKHQRLSIEEFKSCKGFENYTDEQAEETIQSLEKMSLLFYELFMQYKEKEEQLSIIKGGKIYEEEQQNAA